MASGKISNPMAASRIIIADASNAKIGELRIIGKTAIASFQNLSGNITTDGINLGLEFSETTFSLVLYFDGSSNVLGVIEIAENGYLYLLNSQMGRTIGSYITGQCVVETGL